MEKAQKIEFLACMRSTAQALGFALIVVFFVSCTNATDGGPLGPSGVSSSSALIQVTPATATVAKNDTINFAATGGTGTYTWSLSNPTLASIESATGAYTAGTSTGTVTITATDENGSMGTSTVTIGQKSLTVVPSTAQVGKTNTLQFAVVGATEPVFWSSSDTTVGNIDVNTGLFTAGVNTGTITITVLDADGDSGTSSLTVIANTITVTPVANTFNSAGTQIFTGAGGTGNYTWTLSGETGDYTGANLTAQTAPIETTTVTFSQPSSDNGNQTLTITATDGNGDIGTATITLTASAT
tara:strand:+ start:1226 stop:2122 length:897 start_codon:yes stop_codon:yes gene_type:complete